MVGIDTTPTIAMTIVTTAEDTCRSPSSHNSVTFVANGVETQNGAGAGAFHGNGASNSAPLVFVNGAHLKNGAVVNGSPLKIKNDQLSNGTVVNGSGATVDRESQAKDAASQTNGASSNGTAGAAKDMKRQKSGRHAGAGHKTILQSDNLNQYILKTNVYPREHEQLKELRLMTAEHRWNLMLSPADEGQFLQVLLKLMNAKNTIEIGTYTGYSLLATALALPADGKIVAMDLNRDCLNLGWPYIEKAGVANKIDFMGGPALDSLNTLLSDETKHNSFDFAFVDADKNNYMHYHECLLKLVRVGGVIAYDNTLWNGTVAASEEELEEMPKYIRHYQPFICKLNDFLGQDPRIEPALVSIGDGVTLCRRVV